MADRTEPTTGATKEQIEAGERRINKVFPRRPDTPMNSSWRRWAELALEGACPPGHKIISPDDITALREAMKTLDMDSLTDEVLDRYVAIIDGTTDPDVYPAEATT